MEILLECIMEQTRRGGSVGNMEGERLAREKIGTTWTLGGRNTL